MKRLNLRELEILRSLYLRFIEHKNLEELGILQFRAALAKEEKILQKELIKSNPALCLVFKNEEL